MNPYEKVAVDFRFGGGEKKTVFMDASQAVLIQNNIGGRMEIDGEMYTVSNCKLRMKTTGTIVSDLLVHLRRE